MSNGYIEYPVMGLEFTFITNCILRLLYDPFILDEFHRNVHKERIIYADFVDLWMHSCHFSEVTVVCHSFQALISK